MKISDHDRINTPSLLDRLIARQFAIPRRAAKQPKASNAPQVTPTKQIKKTVAAKPDRAMSRKQANHQPSTTTVRKPTFTYIPTSCFADLLKEMSEGSRPMAVEGWEHRTRDGGYVNTPKPDDSKLPCRVEGFGHRARDGSLLR